MIQPKLTWKWERDPVVILDNLKSAVKRRVLRKAMGKAARAMRKALKAASPVRKSRGVNAIPGGTLKQSIDYKVYTPKRQDVSVGVIGAKSSVKKRIQGVRLKFKVGREAGVFTRGKRKGETRYIIPSKYFHLVNRGTKRSRALQFADKVMAATWPNVAANMANDIGAELMQVMQ